jgi:alpha-tubulin suppressor-like RCC1 family protein
MVNTRRRIVFAVFTAVVLSTGSASAWASTDTGHSLGTKSAVASGSGDRTYRWGTFWGPNPNHRATGPKVVRKLSDIVAIAAGNGSDLALDSDGNVWTWGDGVAGVLGDGSTKDHANMAVEVSGLPKIAAIAESDDTDVAITATGSVWGWGWNNNGELCTGNTTEQGTPVELTNLSGVVSAAGGGPHILYLTTSGAVEACGGNTAGELGDGTFTDSTTPVTVTGLPGPVASLSAGQASSTALLKNGEVWDWGYDKFGELGNGTTGTNSDVPVQVALPSAAVQESTGGDDQTNGQSLALLTNGQVWGWGCNSDGQLGDGTTSTADATPVRATALPGDVTFTEVISGGAHSLALDSEGNVWAWGNNDLSQVGNGGKSGNVLTPVKVLTGADMISATANDSVAHASDS